MAVRQGQIETAIAEYGALVTEQRRDLSSANALGDLLVRAGRSPEALPLYLHVADSYLKEGFFSKAAGFYRKVLKFMPDDEGISLRLAEALAQQGLLVEAKAQVLAVAQARRGRGDTAGADQLVLRVAELDPQDLGVGAEAARLLARRGDPAGVERMAHLVDALRSAGRTGEAVALLRDLVDHEVASGRYEAAAAALREHLATDPADVAVLERLVEICSDAELDDQLGAAQERLSEAYLGLGQLGKARFVLEELVLDDPDDAARRMRLASVLIALGEPEPQAAIDRLLDLEAADLACESEGEAPRPESGPPPTTGGEVDLTAALNALASLVDAQPTPAGSAQFPELPETPETLEDVFGRLREEASPRRGTEGRQQLALGRTYLAAGLVEAAIEAFRRAVLDPETRATAAVALAEAFEELEDRTTSLEWLERGADALESPDAERADAMRRLAQALEADGEPDRALAVWLELVTLCPDDPQATDGVARLSARRS
jgi:tetratricopeptide (TPR) repeat protein